jgi:hypothetical protein
MLHIIYIQLKHENKRLLNKTGGKHNDYSGHCTSSLSFLAQHVGNWLFPLSGGCEEMILLNWAPQKDPVIK